MYHYHFYTLVLLLGWSITSCSNERPPVKHLFPLQPEMIINETGCGYGTHITDEQLAKEPKTFWDGYDKEHCKSFSASLIISLQQSVQIADLQIFSEGNAKVVVSAPLNKAYPSFNLKTGWNSIPINTTSAFIKIALSQGAKIGEVLINTTKQYGVEKKPQTAVRKVLMDEFIGTNAFVDVPLGLLEPFGCIREYHDWPDWSEPRKDVFTLNTAENGFDFAHFYRSLQESGKIVVPALQKAPQWLTQNSNTQAKPVAKGSKTEDPLSYQRHALFMTKFTQNFTRKSVGGLQYFENWNEPDKWWEQGFSYFSPYQYASMSSADVDGHLGKIPGMGVKQVPGAKLVMAGLANPKLDYLHALKYWCDKHRNGKFAWDVINYHRYSNSAGLPDNAPKEGISPEAGKLYWEAKEMVSFRNNYLPQTEVWISEFGYDTEKSPQQCPSIGDKNGELVQADWLIRSYVLLSAAGIDKAFQYMIRDFAKEGLYATSGLYSQTIKSTPYLRPAWNYIYTLKEALKGSYFTKLEVDSTQNIFTATFTHGADPTMKSEVVWLGSSEGKTSAYKMNAKSNSTIRIVHFLANSPEGKIENIKNATTITISETPSIIQYHPTGKFPTFQIIKKIPAKEIRCTDNDGNTTQILLDEQDEKQDPLFGLSSQNPGTFWKNSYNKRGPDGIIFYLPVSKKVHSLQIYDGAGEGELEIFTRNGTNWVSKGRVTMNHYNAWRSFMLNTETQELKIVKVKEGPDVGEVILYEK